MKVLVLLLMTSCTIHSIQKKSPIYEEMPFIGHTGSGKYESYLQMNINFDPVKELFQMIDKDLGGTLNKKNARTEAHITTITPVEYRNILEPAGVKIEQINKIALSKNVQSSDFEIRCIGKGTSNTDQTYYLVVASDDLLEIRKEVFKYYVSLGGDPSKWDPEMFYPHITIGYTKRDLHLESDGVFKGINSCWKKIEL